jgi:CubicO group peptidase (beta-lactamase class C family)
MKRKTSIPWNLRGILLLLILVLKYQAGSAQYFPAGTPEKEGFSVERLSRIVVKMNEYVRAGKMPGMVAMVLRHGKVIYLRSFGMMDTEAKKEMTNDAIFRIASMSKAITSVAVMTLYEEGHFLLTDPASKFIDLFLK